jgi:hypothetical protein
MINAAIPAPASKPREKTSAAIIIRVGSLVVKREDGTGYPWPVPLM